jgi:SAM-dependent methyltransferase
LAAPSKADRDTDADWRELGATQPYWGVLTHPDYRTENLTPANLEAFYASGGEYIGDIVRRLKAATGQQAGGRALDFGCGAGRLAEAMTTYTKSVIGFDISPGMLEEARKRGGKATYVGTLPDGPFDWINSFIVFQHIPPERGLALIDDLLARLAPGGLISLHVTVWRDAHLKEPSARGLKRLLRPLVRRWRLARLPKGTIRMYDYDLSQVVERLNRAGIGELALVATDHGGHHGVILLGRKAPSAQSNTPIVQGPV